MSRAQLFSKSSIYVGGSTKNIVADLNNDGHNDVIARVTYLNDGNGNLLPYDSLAIGDYWSGNDVKDLDNDGDLDYIFSEGSLVCIYLNNGAGHFLLDSCYNIDPGFIYDGRACDLNNDGFVDIVVGGHGYWYPANILWNQGNGKFLVRDIPPYGTSTGIDVGDYDNDGDYDLLWSNNMGVQQIHDNDGHGNFSYGFGFFYGYTSGSPYSTFADMNSDGLLDAVLLEHVPMDSSHTYVNNGDGTFSRTGGGFPGYLYKSADVDNDGDDDIAPYYLNDGYGNLTQSSQPWALWTALGDLNNDGLLDMAYSDGFIYYNNTTTHNSPPTVPTGLNAAFTDSSVTFSWNMALDDITPQALLKYNLKVGETPSGNQIMSGVTPPWWPNTEHNTTWTLYLDMCNIPERLYWSVQSQDGSYLRSAWAAEVISIPPILPGAISGTVRDTQSAPIPGVYVLAINTTTNDSTDLQGFFILSGLSPGIYNVYFSHPDYRDTALTNIQVTRCDTTALEAIFRKFICGDANGDRQTTVSDVVYLINYLFKGGPPPNPLKAGDVNCDVKLTVADVVYLINYLFKGGPPPNCC